MTYVVRASFTDRRQGPGTGRTISVEATSMPVALGKAAREFWKQLGRRERNDCKRSGLSVTVLESKTQEAV
ncbi:MAG TPA: hypothetical protein VMH89_10500 [Candidatus Acidoferrum sp.]|nr:hypothetical protein [Candidatus Acidoferrum sp.]